MHDVPARLILRERPGMTSAILLQHGVPAALAAHGCPAHMTYTEAGVVGLIQGLSELFPMSSLGHNVLSRRWPAGAGRRT